MRLENNITVVKALIDNVFSRGNIAKIGDYVSPNFILHDPAFRTPIQGIDAFSQMQLHYAKAFPTKSMKIDEIYALGDKVFVRWRLQGVHKGEFNGLMPSNLPFVVQGISIFRLESGTICELHQCWDRQGLIEQITTSEQAALTSSQRQ